MAHPGVPSRPSSCPNDLLALGLSIEALRVAQPSLLDIVTQPGWVLTVRIKAGDDDHVPESRHQVDVFPEGTDEGMVDDGRPHRRRSSPRGAVVPAKSESAPCAAPGPSSIVAALTARGGGEVSN